MFSKQKYNDKKKENSEYWEGKKKDKYSKLFFSY